MIEIKDATVDNIVLIQDIAEKTWWPTYKELLSAEQIRYMLDTIYSEDSLLNVMRNGSQKFIIIYTNNVASGFASFGARANDHAVYKLYKLYVLPEHHGKGLGKLLINEIKDRLSQNNIHTLDLNVKRDNPAKTFYERLGFKIIQEEDIPLGPYLLQDYIMRLTF
jgi:diamine N-acetyltransferase